MLEHIFVRAAYYEPQDFLDRGDPERALGITLIAGQIKPEHPLVCYNRARAHAQLGHTEEALQALDCAIAAGAFNPASLTEDPYLEPLRSEPRFRELIERSQRQDG